MFASVSVPSALPLTSARSSRSSRSPSTIGLELVGRDDPRPERVGEVLALAHAQAEAHLGHLQVARRPVVEDRVAGDVLPGLAGRQVTPGAADHRRHLELEVEPPAPRRHRDLLAGTGHGVGVGEVAERRLVPDRRDRRVRVRVLDHALDVLLEHREVAHRRGLDRRQQARLGQRQLRLDARRRSAPARWGPRRARRPPRRRFQNPDRRRRRSPPRAGCPRGQLFRSAFRSPQFRWAPRRS